MEIKPGIYKHFKTGNLYKVHFVGLYSEGDNEPMVCYEALYNNPKSKFWVRPAKMFLEVVKSPDGTEKSRFTFISEK